MDENICPNCQYEHQGYTCEFDTRMAEAECFDKMSKNVSYPEIVSNNWSILFDRFIGRE